MVFAVDGSVQEIDVPARPLLGVGAGHGESVVVELPPGSTLVLYTDGLIERRGADVATGVQHLRDAGSAAPAGGPLAEWADQVLAALPEGGDDDTTVLAARVTT
jgi:two-component system, chemotaxis family, sensor kinase Cph1